MNACKARHWQEPGGDEGLTLAGLYGSDIFGKAAINGDICPRLFMHLTRFS
jgi:hypothetical protein